MYVCPGPKGRCFVIVVCKVRGDPGPKGSCFYPGPEGR